jgi:hypothetical protein
VPAGRPGQVTKPTITENWRSVTLTWKAPSSNGSPIAGYAIVASTGQKQVVGASSRSVRFKNLKPGVYTFTVAARNSAGAAAASPAVRVRIR